MLVPTMPAISRYMTAQPWTIERSASLAQAHALMREHQLRHLPVLDKGALVGIVSVGDLHLFETIVSLSLADTAVEEAMTEHPFVVTGDMPLDEVAEIMATKKYGSAIVMGREGVEGIFTTTDACRALAKLLQRNQLEPLLAD
jgi:acetoin utilization protein AcuB